MYKYESFIVSRYRLISFIYSSTIYIIIYYYTLYIKILLKIFKIWYRDRDNIRVIKYEDACPIITNERLYQMIYPNFHAKGNVLYNYQLFAM